VRAWLLLVLQRVAGPNLARDIAGDVEESGGGTRQLLAIVAYITIARSTESLAAMWRSRPRLNGAIADLRYAARSLRRSPWYSITVIGVMALSMALAITVFAVVDGVLFKPLPYKDVQQLVAVEARRAEVAGGTFSVSPSEVTAWQTAVPEAAFASFSIGDRYYIDEGEPVAAAKVSANFFEVLGQAPLVGGFHEPGDRPQALLTYSSWRHRFAGDPAIAGRVIQTEAGRPLEIVGVLPPDFVFPTTLGRFVPAIVELAAPVKDSANNRARSLNVLARVPDGRAAAAIEPRLQAATLALAARFPGTPGKAFTRPFDVTRVRPIDDVLRSAARETFTLVFVAAAALVLLACLNAAGLAAARVQDRRYELTLRRALGGRGGDLVRLLGAESFVIVGAGATLGLGLAALLTRVTALLLPDSLVLFRSLSIDARVVVFDALASTLSVTITALWPARVTLRSAFQPALSACGRSTSRRHGASRFVLIGTQVGVALVMTVVGVLMAGSLARLWREDPGYRVDNTMALTLSKRGDVAADVNARLILDVQHTRGVVAAGGSNQWLLQRAIRGTMFDTPQHSLSVGDVESVGVTPGFFETTAIAPVSGRIPTAGEFAAGAHVAVVSEIVAHAYWPGSAALGQTLMREGVGYAVIGVVPDARYIAFDRAPDGNIYYPLAADQRPSLTTVFLTLDPLQRNVVSSVRSLLASSYPMYRVRSAMYVSETLGKSVQSRQFQAALFSAFGIAGLTIVGVGVLALVAIVTSRRTREVGIRMALGARRLEIAGLIMRQELAAVVCGLGAGGIASFWIVRLVRSYMYKMSVYDPVLWTTAVALMLLVATVGALIPALRASRIDPVKALRVD
jgi:putative ABC transport system permease protein